MMGSSAIHISPLSQLGLIWALDVLIQTSKKRAQIFLPAEPLWWPGRPADLSCLLCVRQSFKSQLSISPKRQQGQAASISRPIAWTLAWTRPACSSSRAPGLARWAPASGLITRPGQPQPAAVHRSAVRQACQPRPAHKIPPTCFRTQPCSRAGAPAGLEPPTQEHGTGWPHRQVRPARILPG